MKALRVQIYGFSIALKTTNVGPYNNNGDNITIEGSFSSIEEPSMLTKAQTGKGGSFSSYILITILLQLLRKHCRILGVVRVQLVGIARLFILL
jgi:hypothetical protein